jgi:GT2 family glycosyltransferase
MNKTTPTRPKISVVVLNYNGQAWLPRCFESLEKQTIFNEIEVLVVDNQSPDGSARLAAEWAQRAQNVRLMENETNLYFCGGNNRGAAAATGKYLFFLNNDTWLERDCLATLIREVEAAAADAATPLTFNYDDETYQSLGGAGLDLFGMVPGLRRFDQPRAIFAAYGAAFFIRADVFQKIGGFDEKLLMYVDESDLSWRVWIAGGKIIGVPAARMHHRGSPTANPAGGVKQVELRTNETKRFLSNRNGLLVLMKNGQHILLLLLIPHLVLLLVEALVSLILLRNGRYVRKAYFEAIVAAFRMHGHVWSWRRRIHSFRQRGDFALLRFITWRLNRWGELMQVLRLGLPKITPPLDESGSLKKIK